ncbi:MAG: DUF3558 domain-containing protein [Actinomycetota bacterium]|nr:DUF3558 domain-containing protein [Actinomycetota bacterium]
MTAQHPRILAATVLACTGLLVAACSSNPTAPAGYAQAATRPTATHAAAVPAAGGEAGASAPPCSLLTQAEVDAAVGQRLGPGKQTTALDDCQWTTSDFTAGVSVSVSDWQAIKAAATANGHTPRSVPGVGDEALTNGGGLLYVRRGNGGFLLTINGSHVDALPDQGLAQEKVLATAVLGRL